MMRSVQRILAVFESFTPTKTSLTLQEMADLIELPKSTAFRIVRSLEQAGYLVRLEDQRYCLSFRFTRLAGMVQSTLDIRAIARPLMVDLATQIKETVAIHSIVGRNRVCIDSFAASASALRSVIVAGEQMPLQGGSASKALLAFLPKTELAQILPSVVKITKRTQAELLSEYATVRKNGCAVSHGERLLGLSAISAPIWDINDQVHYCITVNGPTVRIQGHEKEYTKLVKQAAAEISLQFGSKADLAQSD
jgi:DNA-binding IclR family transcriptional regulator